MLGFLSMAGPIITLISGALVSLAIIARDLSIILSPRWRAWMVAVGAIGMMVSGGIGFVVDSALQVPLVSFAYVYAVVASSIMVAGAIVRWIFSARNKLSATDQIDLQRVKRSR